MSTNTVTYKVIDDIVEITLIDLALHQSIDLMELSDDSITTEMEATNANYSISWSL